jgi:hypothetical protein
LKSNDNDALWAALVVLATVVLVLGCYGLKEPACATATTIEPSANCFEFWLNRYQTAVIGVIGVVAAIVGAVSAWNAVQLQLTYHDKQAIRIANDIGLRMRFITEELIDELDQFRMNGKDIGHLQSTLMQFSGTGISSSVAELRGLAENCGPLVRFSIRQLSDVVERIPDACLKALQNVGGELQMSKNVAGVLRAALVRMITGLHIPT